MKRYELMRCWQGTASTLVPQPIGYRYWTRRGAERAAARMTAAMRDGRWFEVRRRVPSDRGVSIHGVGQPLPYDPGCPAQEWSPEHGYGYVEDSR